MLWLIRCGFSKKVIVEADDMNRYTARHIIANRYPIIGKLLPVRFGALF